MAIFKFLPSNIYILLLVFLDNNFVSGSRVTSDFTSLVPFIAKLDNFFTKLPPFCKYNEEELISFSSSILLNENNTVEYSLVLSVAPFNSIYELSSVTILALCIDIFLLISSLVP